MSNKFMHGSPLLMGDNTIPGLRLPEELRDLIPKIYDAVKTFGCDCYPAVVQMLTYDEISEVAAYGGFPVRYPHWRWGMGYEELQRGYQHGMHRIYEMVVNTNPCYIYCLDSNTMTDNVTVIAHALGHNDFFKNNVFFGPTSQNMMNELANHGTRMRKYMQRWGKGRVTEFIDFVLRIETLIDPVKAWQTRKIVDPVVRDVRTYKHPHRLDVKEGHEHMEPFINPARWRQEQQEDIEEAERAKEIGIFREPTKDILGFLRDHAPLKPWQSDILAMLYEEAMYFAPQRMTHMMNEGWASFTDFNILCKMGLCSLGQAADDMGIVEYATHKTGVLGGKYSMNPYKLGSCLFHEIEERWDKGKFGTEYEECTDIVAKEHWDKKLGLGHAKVFDVRRFYDDFSILSEFFDEEFCQKFEFFEWRHYPNGDWKIESREFRKIKQLLISRYINGGYPDIRLADPNYKGKGYILLQHEWDGRTLLDPYVRAVLHSIAMIWGKEVFLATRDHNGEEIVYTAYGEAGSDDTVELMPRKAHEEMMEDE